MSKDNVLRIKLCSVRTSIFVTTAEMFPVSFGSGRSKWQDAFMCQSQKIFQNLRLLHSNKIKTEGSSYKFWFFCKNSRLRKKNKKHWCNLLFTGGVLVFIHLWNVHVGRHLVWGWLHHQRRRGEAELVMQRCASEC